MTQYSLNRRNFLQLTGGIATSVVLHQILPASAKNINSNGYLEGDVIDLVIAETKVKISDRSSSGKLVNGSLPSPTIRLKEGQNVTINVKNNLNEDTSIHWHGLILPANMDGVPGVSFRGIKPKETFTYQFPVNQSGTYWYHSHSNMQEPLGMYGAIIIDPLEPEPYKCDRDYVIILSDWSFENPHAILANLKKMPTYYNYQRRTVANLAQDWKWKQMRMDSADIADVTGATYTYLMNGKTSNDNWTGIFNKGEKVRLRFINASAMTLFDVRIPNLPMTVIQADGQNVQPVTVDEIRIGVAETYDVIVEPDTQEAYTIFAESLDRSGYVRGTLGIKEGLSAEIPPRRERPLRTMDDMGMDHNAHSGHNNQSSSSSQDHSNHNSSSSNHSNHQSPSIDGSNHNQHQDHDMSNMSHSDHSNHDMSNMDHSDHSSHNISEKETLDFSWQPRGEDNNGIGNAATPMMVKNRLNEAGVGLENVKHRVLVYTDLKSVKPLKNRRKFDREITLYLTGNMERYMWSFNGKKYSEDKEIDFYYGERLRLTFVNDTMMEHPIHLHGMWMELVNGNGDYQPRKHTIIVKPAEKLSTEIDVDAKGKWAFHCHLMYHMDVGMFRTINVIS
ncbi:copper resistance system multicopper oxidase [Cyanobacterium aponinum]|uniref:Copper-resistance protein, CopA family n=1 Tax=Cyanobacterium aponinum (strain PCC 10605) TaxID=755178 RepID=K9Z493_CYAAP|nr:copper resistance system multicopper oxidase [Cyanobacterium aponinum]AFZ53178.1 copper-resistance protein, CopA family [Cyanobacterium aponinum PCC 10605]